MWFTESCGDWKCLYRCSNCSFVTRDISELTGCPWDSSFAAWKARWSLSGFFFFFPLLLFTMKFPAFFLSAPRFMTVITSRFLTFSVQADYFFILGQNLQVSMEYYPSSWLSFDFPPSKLQRKLCKERAEVIFPESILLLHLIPCSIQPRTQRLNHSPISSNVSHCHLDNPILLSTTSLSRAKAPSSHYKTQLPITILI